MKSRGQKKTEWERQGMQSLERCTKSMARKSESIGNAQPGRPREGNWPSVGTITRGNAPCQVAGRARHQVLSPCYLEWGRGTRHWHGTGTAMSWVSLVRNLRRLRNWGHSEREMRKRETEEGTNRQKHWETERHRQEPRQNKEEHGVMADSLIRKGNVTRMIGRLEEKLWEERCDEIERILREKEVEGEEGERERGRKDIQHGVRAAENGIGPHFETLPTSELAILLSIFHLSLR